jgi:hypothetical protein
MTQRRNKPTGKQTMVVALPHESSWREPTLEAERILMVDFVTTLPTVKGAKLRPL